MSATRVMQWSITLVLLVLIQLLPPMASAQRRGSDRGRGERTDRGRGDRGRGDRGRGDRGRGGWGGDRGRGGWGGGSSRGGSSRGGWGGGGRGGRGGGRGGRGGFDSTSFLRRLDRNGDGTLDASEQEGPARFILDRMRDRIPNLPPAGRPISIERLARDMRGGGREERSSSSSSAVEPLVPGFGIDELIDPPLGFGPEEEKFRVEKTPEDLREADNTLSRYDRDQDGVLDQNELRRVRWRSGWEQHDRNGDGKLTRVELATRYAMERINDEGSSSSRRSSSGRSERGRSERGRSERGRSERGRGDRGRGGSSRGGWGGFAGFGGRGGSGGSSRIADFMFGRYDQNQSGVLEKDEWGSIRGGGAEEADKNKDQKITKEELSAWMSNRMSQGGGRGGRGRGSSEGRGDGGSSNRRASSRSRGSRSESSRDRRSSSASSAPGSYRGRDADERLSSFEDLPEWFGELDANRDGQVMMAEYYASWSAKKASDFRQFDLNDDGIVTPKEAIAAGQDGAVRGAGSSSRSRDRGTSRTSSSSRSRSSRSGSSGSRAEQYRKHAANWLQKFDTDKDGVLVKEEWSKDGFTYTTADADGDDKVTVNELAEAMAKK